MLKSFISKRKGPLLTGPFLNIVISTLDFERGLDLSQSRIVV
jgi:hypothetical protein